MNLLFVVGCQSTLVEDDPGILHCSAAQVVGQQLPRSYTLAQRTTKEIPKLEPKTGLYSSEKIKLQLFPIDEATRIELEKVSLFTGRIVHKTHMWL